MFNKSHYHALEITIYLNSSYQKPQPVVALVDKEWDLTSGIEKEEPLLVLYFEIKVAPPGATGNRFNLN